MSEGKCTKLDIKHDKWPKYNDVLTNLEVHKPVTKFNNEQDILGSIPERIVKEREQIGVVGKGTNKLRIGKL
jgi:hypothetical protein